jgi:hypothetical protein
LSLLRQLAAADQSLATSLARPLAHRIEDLLGIGCFRLARLCCLVSLCGDTAVNLALRRWGGIGGETGASFAIGLCAAAAVILRSLMLEQETQALSAASPIGLAFKFGRWLILLYAAFAGACFLGGIGLGIAGIFWPELAAPQPPFAALRFVADRLGDASFLLALYCLELRPRGAGGKTLAPSTP